MFSNMFLKYTFCFKNNLVEQNKVSRWRPPCPRAGNNNVISMMEKRQNNDNDDEFFWFNKMLNLSRYQCPICWVWCTVRRRNLPSNNGSDDCNLLLFSKLISLLLFVFLKTGRAFAVLNCAKLWCLQYRATHARSTQVNVPCCAGLYAGGQWMGPCFWRSFTGQPE